jgi:drug/metabolite transporter (DMT)-like permease
MSWRAWLAFAALGLIWGLPYFFIKLAVQEISPFAVAFGRILLALAILLPLALRKGALQALRGHWVPVIAFGIAEFAVPFSAISLGERWIDSSVTGILIAAVPLVVAAISPLFGVREDFGVMRVAGLVLGLVGVMTLVGFGSINGATGWIGVACMIIAATGYAVGPLIIQRYLGGVDSLGPIVGSLLVAGLILVVPAVATGPRYLPSNVALVSVLILGVLCTSIAMLLMFYLVSHAGASRASVITYINPAVATLLGVLVLHEHLGVGGLLGFALILMGSWLATRGTVTVAKQQSESLA